MEDLCTVMETPADSHASGFNFAPHVQIRTKDKCVSMLLHASLVQQIYAAGDFTHQNWASFNLQHECGHGYISLHTGTVSMETKSLSKHIYIHRCVQNPSINHWSYCFSSSDGGSWLCLDQRSSTQRQHVSKDTVINYQLLCSRRLCQFPPGGAVQYRALKDTKAEHVREVYVDLVEDQETITPLLHLHSGFCLQTRLLTGRCPFEEIMRWPSARGGPWVAVRYSAIDQTVESNIHVVFPPRPVARGHETV